MKQDLSWKKLERNETMTTEERKKTNWVRYEVILPFHFNDGKRVPADLFNQTYAEVMKQFGGVSRECQSIRGLWKDDKGEVFSDENFRFFVDCQDTEEALAWFREYKEAWKLRFKQHELWITSHPLRIV